MVVWGDPSPYVGICVKCDKLKELDTSTALCEKCSPATGPKTKKEDSNGS